MTFLSVLLSVKMPIAARAPPAPGLLLRSQLPLPHCTPLQKQCSAQKELLQRRETLGRGRSAGEACVGCFSPPSAKNRTGISYRAAPSRGPLFRLGREGKCPCIGLRYPTIRLFGRITALSIRRPSPQWVRMNLQCM